MTIHISINNYHDNCKHRYELSWLLFRRFDVRGPFPSLPVHSALIRHSPIPERIQNVLGNGRAEVDERVSIAKAGKQGPEIRDRGHIHEHEVFQRGQAGERRNIGDR